MIGDRDKFVECESYDEGVVRFGNNAPYSIKGKRFIIVDGRTNTEDVYFVDGLKHNLLSIGQLVDKGCHLQFSDKKCTIKDKQ